MVDCPSLAEAVRRVAIGAAASACWLYQAFPSGAVKRGAKLYETTEQLTHRSAVGTSMYVHFNPEESSGRYLAV